MPALCSDIPITRLYFPRTFPAFPPPPFFVPGPNNLLFKNPPFHCFNPPFLVQPIQLTDQYQYTNNYENCVTMHLSQLSMIVCAGTFVPDLAGWLILFVPNVLRYRWFAGVANGWAFHFQCPVVVMIRGCRDTPARFTDEEA